MKFYFILIFSGMVFSSNSAMSQENELCSPFPQWRQNLIVFSASAYYNWKTPVASQLLKRYMSCTAKHMTLTPRQSLDLIFGIWLPDDLVAQAKLLESGDTLDVEERVKSYAKHSGTLGHYSQNFKGTINMTDLAGWEFQGLFWYRDVYDFNPSDHRDPQQERDVSFARRNIKGEPFEIIVDPFEIRINGFGIDYFDEASGEWLNYVEFNHSEGFGSSLNYDHAPSQGTSVLSR